MKSIGFGTYRLKGDVCYKAVLDAIAVGYRIIDTATYYENFIPIGRALKEVNRDKVFISSKVWPDAHTPKLLLQDLNKTLKELDTDFLDLYFLHWPNSCIPLKETLGVLNQLMIDGLIRSIGLSNVTVNHLRRALELPFSISWVQVEMSPFFCDFELLEFCQLNAISVQAWAPLSVGVVNQDPLLQKIGKRYKKTASQVALKWGVQHGVVPLPASRSIEHIIENMAIFDFELTKSEMDEIDQRAKRGSRKRQSFDEFDFSYEKCWPL